MRYFPILAGAFVATLMVSQVTATKPVQLGVVFTGGDLIFPLSYVMGDVLTEVYGFARSRAVIWTGLAANVFMSTMSWFVGILPGEPGWVAEGGQQAWDMLLGLTPRIALASIVAYFVGEFLNAYVLAKLKVAMEGRHLWLRSIGSTLIGQAVDSLIFFPIAYGGEWPWSLIWRVTATAYGIKIATGAFFTPLVYALASYLKRAEGIDVYDRDTDFNPFRIRLGTD